MAKYVPKFIEGGPIIEWCQGLGLDADRIPVSKLACQPTTDDLNRRYRIVAWEMYEPSEVVSSGSSGDWRWSGDFIEVERVVYSDDPPPLNPEWVALFGEDAAWGSR